MLPDATLQLIRPAATRPITLLAAVSGQASRGGTRGVRGLWSNIGPRLVN